MAYNQDLNPLRARGKGQLESFKIGQFTKVTKFVTPILLNLTMMTHLFRVIHSGNQPEFGDFTAIFSKLSSSPPTTFIALTNSSKASEKEKIIQTREKILNQNHSCSEPLSTTK